MPPPRIVAAVSRDLQHRIRAILPECELHFARTGSQLVRMLDEAPCDMMIVEMHFDESTAVAALKCARSRNETVPVVCVRSAPFAKLRWRALGELGAQHFIDLVQHADDAIGNARVRSMLETLVGWVPPASVTSTETTAAISGTGLGAPGLRQR